MKITFLPAILLMANSLNAQVGVNTTNPLGTFHVDGNKDNAATPTSVQQAKIL